jgi:hypothetical protein
MGFGNLTYNTLVVQEKGFLFCTSAVKLIFDPIFLQGNDARAPQERLSQLPSLFWMSRDGRGLDPFEQGFRDNAEDELREISFAACVCPKDSLGTKSSCFARDEIPGTSIPDHWSQADRQDYNEFREKIEKNRGRGLWEIEERARRENSAVEFLSSSLASVA